MSNNRKNINYLAEVEFTTAPSLAHTSSMLARLKGRRKRISTQSEKTTLFMVCVATVIVFSNMYLPQPLLPIIGQEFGLSPSQAGLTISSLVFGIAFSTVFIGLLSDRIGRYSIMLICTSALCIPTLLCAVAPNFGLLIACRFGQGLVIPGFISTVLAYLHEEFPKRRGANTAWYTVASVIGGFNGRLQAGIFNDLFNWRVAFLIFGVFDIIAALLLWFYLPPSKKFAAQAGASSKVEKGFGRNLLLCLKNRRLVGTYIVGAAIFFTFAGAFTYLPYYLTRAPFNLSELLISSVFVTYLVGIVSAPNSNKLSQRFGRKRIMLGNIGLMIVGLLLTLISWLPIVLLGLLIICWAMFSLQASSNAMVGESVGSGEGFGSAISLYQLFCYVGSTAGGFVPGLLWQSSSTAGWLLVVIGFVAVLIVGLASLKGLCR